MEELQAQIHTLGQAELAILLQGMSVLQVTKVLHGDYDLKLARQDYFISKQNMVRVGGGGRNMYTSLTHNGRSRTAIRL